MKILHLKFDSAKLFLETDKHHNALYDNLEESIITKHMMRNVLLKLTGEIPIPHYHETLYGTIVKNDIEFQKLISELDIIIDNSMYKLNEYDYIKSVYLDKIKYIDKFRQGLRAEVTDSLTKSFINGVEVYGYAWWDRLKCFDGVNQDLLNNLLDLFYTITGKTINDVSLERMVVLLSKSDKRFIITDFIIKHEIHKYTYLNRLLCGIVDGTFINGAEKIEIRFNLGTLRCIPTLEIKKCLNISGDIIVKLSDNIYRKLMKSYTTSKIFDGGCLYIHDVYDSEDINTDYVFSDYKLFNTLQS